VALEFLAGGKRGLLRWLWSSWPREAGLAGLARDGEEQEPEKRQSLIYRVPRRLYEELPSEDTAWRFRTCAVVGNSGVLLNKPYGAAIDRADAIFRINNAPIEQFAPHCGSRTTFSIINQHHARSMAFEGVKSLHSKARLLVYESTYASVRLETYPRLLKQYPGDALLMSPEIVVRGYTLWLQFKALVEKINREVARGHSNGNPIRTSFKRKPMTGFFGVLFAIQICNNVKLYGFSGYNRYENNGARRGKVPYHYFDSVPGATQVHSFDLSLQVFKLMARVHNITMVD
ncbi:glycosyltransferase 29 protein, partial [Cymbomonas tetramitiformis]